MTLAEQYYYTALDSWANELTERKETLKQYISFETDFTHRLVMSEEMYNLDITLHRLESILVNASFYLNEGNLD